MDCPPVEIVADAEIINPVADLTLFAVRAGLMERSFLVDIERWYCDKKFHNLTLVLNGTTDAHRSLWLPQIWLWLWRLTAMVANGYGKR